MVYGAGQRRQITGEAIGPVREYNRMQSNSVLWAPDAPRAERSIDYGTVYTGCK